MIPQSQIFLIVSNLQFTLLKAFSAYVVAIIDHAYFNYECIKLNCLQVLLHECLPLNRWVNY